MVEALAPNRTNHPFHVGSLPGRTRRRQHLLYAHVSDLFCEVLAENRIAISQQVAWGLVKGTGFSQLLARPLRSRVAGHVEVENAATIMDQDQKHVEDLEANGRYGEEIDGDELGDVVLEESAPGLCVTPKDRNDHRLRISMPAKAFY